MHRHADKVLRWLVDIKLFLKRVFPDCLDQIGPHDVFEKLGGDAIFRKQTIRYVEDCLRHEIKQLPSAASSEKLLSFSAIFEDRNLESICDEGKWTLFNSLVERKW